MCIIANNLAAEQMSCVTVDWIWTGGDPYPPRPLNTATDSFYNTDFFI